MAIVTHPANKNYRDGWSETFGKKEAPSDLAGVPRRRRMDLMTPSELACLKAISEIEGLGCDERLTQAQILIGKAQDLVADVVDSRR